ncbi:histone-arginine methyltransferase METTL23 [Phlebotomus argentipes]|uniref:histone-arginine methyltransferase METTL23 n=1 Tax=Phlebotomus argentipes TaxID=94469 RepID=UPI002892E56F|nr:histone-arginine methyltransferase METTL23 [Phlebotomus argentipes]
MTLSMVESGSTSAESFRKFIFGQDPDDSDTDEVCDSVEILIPELLQASYSSYTWPSAPILSLFLWKRRASLTKKRILELGSGTSLPGILAAKCGAQVTLSDRTTLPKTLAHIQRCCQLNNLTPGKDIAVKGLSWGLLLNSIFDLGPIDLIIGSDIFYDPSVFEDILVTVAFLLEQNPGAKFLFTYQERSADWSIEATLKKWKLKCANVSLSGITAGFDKNLKKFMGGHSVHLLEITLA